MVVLIKQAKIVDPASPKHGEEMDVLIRDGRIEQIDTGLAPPKGATLIDEAGTCLSAGWLDIGAQPGDPGFEHREDLQTLGRTAAAGGFTALAVAPNTFPCVDSKSQVQYLLHNSREALVELYPIGAVSAHCEGKDLTEMLDMRQAGAVAFSDGALAIQHGGLMMRALLYVKAFDGIVLNLPFDRSIAVDGQMHEGYISTVLGLKGIPSMAEELMAIRDISLAAYTGSRVLIHGISAAETVELIRAAKARGEQVFASTPALNLALDDRRLEGFDSLCKVLPPLRSAADREALLQGLADGTIDLVVSNHVPLEEEAKSLEFPYADFGAIGLETVYPILQTHLGDRLSIERIVELLAVRPRQLLGLPAPSIEVGAPANLTLFQPDATWTYEQRHILSRSANTPLIGTTFRGRVLAVVNRGQLSIRQE